MNLWIRSQDRIILSKVDAMQIKERQNRNYKYGDLDKANEYSIHNGFIEIGIYATKERALEVLDEIQNKISEYKMVDIGYHSEFICNNIVYEMPEE